MNTQDVLTAKEPHDSVIAAVINGDAKTYKRVFVLPRFADGVDLSGLSWSVKYKNANNAGDVHFVGTVEPSGPNIRIPWVFPQAIAAATGNATCSLEGVGTSGEVWRSGTYTIKVINAHTPGATYQQSALNEVSQLIADVGISVSAMKTQIDGFETRITNAVTSATSAATSATNAAESARNATVETVIAKGLATDAATSATSAAQSATSAAATATSAANNAITAKDAAITATNTANTATNAANTAAQNAQNIADEVQRKLAAGELNGAPGEPGSDANVTNQNVISAIGYTPANAVHTHGMSDVNGLATALAGKVDASGFDAAVEGVIEISETISDIKESQRNRVQSLDNTELCASTIESHGVPIYVNESDISDYSAYSITSAGWYVFARIYAKNGHNVSEDFGITGVAGYIHPAISSDHVDVAVRFGIAAETQIVRINWGAYSEAFAFKATDLAVRNLDYRVTYYVYDISPFAKWTYGLTSDTTFVSGVSYYTLENGVYTIADVTVGEAIPASTYYVHTLLEIDGFARNVSYSGANIDCPVKIYLPEINESGYGAWVEIQTVFTKANYSVTLVPPTGAHMSTSSVTPISKGINMLNIQYHVSTKTWYLTNTVWKT